MKDKKDAQSFFTNLGNQFLNANLEGIANEFFYPCMIDNARTPVAALLNADELMAHEKPAVEGFAAMKLTSFEVSIQKMEIIKEVAGVVHVAYDLFSDGNQIGTINWLYEVVQCDTDPKIWTAKFIG